MWSLLPSNSTVNACQFQMVPSDQRSQLGVLCAQSFKVFSNLERRYPNIVSVSDSACGLTKKVLPS